MALPALAKQKSKQNVEKQKNGNETKQEYKDIFSPMT